MKKSTAIGALALLLAGCQTVAYYELRTGNPASAQVAVVDNYLVVGREPMLIAREKGKPATATWTLPSGGRFDGSGIVVKGRTKSLAPREPGRPRIYTPLKELDTTGVKDISCAPNESRAEVTCRIGADVPAGLWIYDVRVAAPAGLIVLDPTFMLE
jgi:hypothetical protein